jgi:hypothetical protein
MKNFSGLTPEERARLLDLEKSVELDKANHQHAAKTHKVGVCLILTPGMDGWPRSPVKDHSSHTHG